jgi:hypothetical protein
MAAITLKSFPKTVNLKFIKNREGAALGIFPKSLSYPQTRGDTGFGAWRSPLRAESPERTRLKPQKGAKHRAWLPAKT